MGFISNFGDRDILMMRRGLAYQGGINPELFVVTEINENKYMESWGQGVEVFHNPDALVPLPEFLLPDVAHTTVRAGQIVSIHPPFFPVGSITVILTPEG